MGPILRLAVNAFLAAASAVSAAEPSAPPAVKPDKAYYKKLYAACRSSPAGKSCCESSVRRMEKNGWRSAAGPTLAQSGCPEGTQPDTLKCMGALRWCAPGAPPKGPTKPSKPPPRPDMEFYIGLRTACASKTSPSCCEASVARMESKGGTLVIVGPDGERSCPEGTTPDMLRCADSYQWCVAEDPMGARPAAPGPPGSPPPAP